MLQSDSNTLYCCCCLFIARDSYSVNGFTALGSPIQPPVTCSS